MTDVSDEIIPGMEISPPKRSREIDKLAVALAKAQGAMENAKRASENPGFKREGRNSKYSDLGSVWEAIREPLSSNGLSVVQLPTTLQSGVEIETILLHESGQYLRNILWMPCGQTMTVHTIGSAITYGRRYALMAIAGVAPEEDDGNSAAGVGEHKPGAPGTAGGGTDFRLPGPRRGNNTSWGAGGKQGAIDEAQRDGLTRPAAKPKAADAVELAQWCKDSIAHFKDIQTKNDLVDWWKGNLDKREEAEAAMPNEFERVIIAYDARMDTVAAKGP